MSAADVNGLIIGLALLAIYLVVLGTLLSVVHHIARNYVAPNTTYEKKHRRKKLQKESVMTKRIIAITFIFICSSVAWLILGTTIFSRTYNSGFASDSRVESTWGSAQNQAPPTAGYIEVETKDQEVVENGVKVFKALRTERTIGLPLESSNISVHLDLQHRQKGLLWYSTYKVGFNGNYVFRNISDQEQSIKFELKFPASKAIYDNLTFTVDGLPAPLTTTDNGALATMKIHAGKTTLLAVGYNSQGLNEWRYSFGATEVAQVRDFTLRMTTNFKDIDFPDNTLSPSEKSETQNGWDLTWNYNNLLSGYQIAMTMPEKLQPGPLAGKISFFAPVSLFFFFFLMLVITTMRGIDLHPMNYFFLAAAFFSFHLLLAYLVDHISIHSSFAISAAVSIFLVITYLRLVVGIRFASREAALAQFVYLVMFSYAFFLNGFTGLAITIGSVLSLFVVMQMTGRIRWTEKFSGSPPQPVAEPT